MEPSCGASLSVTYTPSLLSNVLPQLNHQSNVVMIVCGGSNINFEQLTDFKTKFASQGQQPAIAVRNGDQIMLKMTHSPQEEETSPAQRYIISTSYRSPVPESEAAANGSSATPDVNERMTSPPAEASTNHDGHVAVKTEETTE